MTAPLHENSESRARVSGNPLKPELGLGGFSPPNPTRMAEGPLRKWLWVWTRNILSSSDGVGPPRPVRSPSLAGSGKRHRESPLLLALPLRYSSAHLYEVEKLQLSLHAWAVVRNRVQTFELLWSVGVRGGVTHETGGRGECVPWPRKKLVGKRKVGHA